MEYMQTPANQIMVSSHQPVQLKGLNNELNTRSVVYWACAECMTYWYFALIVW